MVQNKGNATSVKPFSLSTFNFSTKHGFYIYNGSVTMPPCWENVLWILSTQILNVTKKEVCTFCKFGKFFLVKMNIIIIKLIFY